MRHLRLLLATLAVCLCLAPATSALAAATNVYGQLPCTGANSTSAACNATGDPISGQNGVLGKATTLISYITGIASIILMLIGGIMYITSDGDSGKVSSAKNTILYAVIGLVIVLLARAIIVFVINKA